MSRSVKSVLVVAFAFVIVLFTAGVASAHSVLLATNPVESSRVASAPASVVLTFNEMPRAEYSDIHVLGPDNARRDSGHVKVLNDTVTEGLGGTRPAGTYVVDWRVISADGHPVSGQFSFTALSAASTLPPRQPDTNTAAATKKSGSSVAVIIVAVVVLVVLVGAAVFFVLRPRKSRPGKSSRPDDRPDDPEDE